MASGEKTTPYESLTDAYQNTYMLQPTENKTMGHMDQITFHEKVITESSMILKPGTTVMITSNLAPAPYVPDGLYTVKDNNLVQLTMRNTDMCPLKLLKGKPITGITVHLLNEDYFEEVQISKDTLRTYFLSQEISTDNPILHKTEINPQQKEPHPNST